MSNNADLLKWTTSEVDFYELLGITPETFSESELRRAYRKTALKYHPDKAGKDFDPQKYETFQAANDILSDPALKAKYDNHRQAKIQKQRANELFEGKRRQMKEDLEARERAGGSTFTGQATAGTKRPSTFAFDDDFRKAAERGREMRAKMAKKAQAAGESMFEDTPKKSRTSPSAPKVDIEARQEELERRLRELEAKAERKAKKESRRSGAFDWASSRQQTRPTTKEEVKGEKLASTPMKNPEIIDLTADERSSASPKFCFSPNIPTPNRNDFAATMARLKAAEKARVEEHNATVARLKAAEKLRLEEQIRQLETET